MSEPRIQATGLGTWSCGGLHESAIGVCAVQCVGAGRIGIRFKKRLGSQSWLLSETRMSSGEPWQAVAVVCGGGDGDRERQAR